MSWFLLLSFIGLLLFVVSKPVKAQEKIFTLGVVADSEALMCHTQEDAQVIADNKGEESPEIKMLVLLKKCGFLVATGVYIQKVYEKDGWAVYEFSIGSRSFYEATDWIGKPKGQVDT